MNKIKFMWEAVENKTAKVLDVETARELLGQKIRTIYFGYKDQNGVDEFVIGEIISEYEYAERNPCDGYENQARYWDKIMTRAKLAERKNTMIIITDDGRNTYFRAYTENKGIFSCTDIDRFVYFIHLKHPDSQRTVKTKDEAIAGARAELAKYFKLESFNSGRINEIPANQCASTDYLPAIQLIAEGDDGVNTIWRYTDEN